MAATTFYQTDQDVALRFLLGIKYLESLVIEATPNQTAVIKSLFSHEKLCLLSYLMSYAPTKVH